LAAIKFITTGDQPVTVRVYPYGDNNPSASLNGVVPNTGTWTRINFDENPLPADIDTFLLSIQSDQNALGYAATNQGQGRAFIKTSGIFLDLANFKAGENFLTGDWAIRALVYTTISKPATLTLEQDSLFFWHQEIVQNLSIRNSGNEELAWYIDDELPPWLNVEPASGVLGPGTEELSFNVNRDLLVPGIHRLWVSFNSNVGKDSVYISVLERNAEHPQIANTTEPVQFSETRVFQSLKLINIGTSAGIFRFRSFSTALNFFPSEGLLEVDDTLYVDVFLDPFNLTSKTLQGSFFNGINEFPLTFLYDGIPSEPTDKLSILSPFPNPFARDLTPEVVFRIRLTNTETATLRIYNLLGQQVKVFSLQPATLGLHLIEWNTLNTSGQKVSAGIYLLVLQQAGHYASQKILIL
jgi:hypothetical protein